MDSITQTIRAKLFAGVATLLPLYLTYVVIRFLFESLEEMSGPILERFGLGIPGLGLILTIILIYLLGIIVTNFLGRKIFKLITKFIVRFKDKSIYLKWCDLHVIHCRINRWHLIAGQLLLVPLVSLFH